MLIIHLYRCESQSSPRQFKLIGCWDWWLLNIRFTFIIFTLWIIIIRIGSQKWAEKRVWRFCFFETFLFLLLWNCCWYEWHRRRFNIFWLRDWGWCGGLRCLTKKHLPSYSCRNKSSWLTYYRFLYFFLRQYFMLFRSLNTISKAKCLANVMTHTGKLLWRRYYTFFWLIFILFSVIFFTILWI